MNEMNLFSFIPWCFALSMLIKSMLYLFENDWKVLHQRPHLFRQSILIDSKGLFRVIVSIGCSISLLIFYEKQYFIFYLLILCAIIIFSPYLMKASPFISCCLDRRRSCHDKLMITSMIYAISCLFSFLWYEDLDYSFFCLITTIGSLVYHYFREGRFFNFDNIFATVHFFVYCFTLTDSYGKCNEYFIFGLVSFPIALFSLVHCGLPAQISFPSEGMCVRESRPIYDNWHAVWHLSSGVGPTLSLFYLHSFYFELNVMGYLERRQIYTLALIASTLINIGANWLGIIPLD